MIIRSQQMEVFEDSQRFAFEEEMVTHSMAFSPVLCRVLGNDQLRLVVRAALRRAEGYGFTCRGPIRLVHELTFLFGSHFDSDPQYPWAGEILRATGPEMQRAEQLYQGTLDYQGSVSGQDGVNTRRALRDLSILARQPGAFSSASVESELRREMTRIFPEKVAYIGPDGLSALIGEGLAQSRRYGLPSQRGAALLVSLMFAFGHGCLADPLYPWIERTLTDDRIIDSAGREQRLEKKAVTWLDHVLAADVKEPDK